MIQPDPPDIICDVVGEGRLAIEIVALDAPQTRSRLDNMITTDEAWERAAAKLTILSSASPSAMKPVFVTEQRGCTRHKSFFFKIPAMPAYWPPRDSVCHEGLMP
jgi:hypothetical protein